MSSSALHTPFWNTGMVLYVIELVGTFDQTYASVKSIEIMLLVYTYLPKFFKLFSTLHYS